MFKVINNFYYNLEGAVLLTQWSMYGRFMREIAGSVMLRLTTILTGFAIMVILLKFSQLGLIYAFLLGTIPVIILLFYFASEIHKKNTTSRKIEDFKSKSLALKLFYLVYVISISYGLPLLVIIFAIARSK